MGLFGMSRKDKSSKRVKTDETSAASEDKKISSAKDRIQSDDTTAPVTNESVYQYYSQHLFPAIMSSLPILARRLATDSVEWLRIWVRRFLDFLLPKWSSEHPELPTLRQLWEQTATHKTIEDLLRQFDTNNDGHISSVELLNMTEIMQRLPRPHPDTWWAWFAREWPLMEWKVGVFLWRTFGGILFLLVVFSIIPGRLHAVSAKILRWPILALTYWLVVVELMVYVVIRLFIRVAEDLIARPKHRKLRRKMAQAKSYTEWYSYAAALDRSQKRDKWLLSVDDDTSYRYNWGFIRELIKDMRVARSNGDSLLALAVVQQCTRKNVGGVMSEDLFSYSNTGEPKLIVREFIQEVVTTLKWITDEALKAPTEGEEDNDSTDKEEYDEALQKEVRREKDKLWKSMLSTLNFLDNSQHGSPVQSKKVPGRRSPRGSRKRSLSNPKLSPTSSQSPGVGESKEQQSLHQLPLEHHREQVLAFMKRARGAYGRTALCLSGGAMMGLYHFGHVIGLLETGTLPHIISGTSAGSIVAAILCTRTEEELKTDLQPEVLIEKLVCFKRPWRDRIKSVFETGNLFDFDEWMELIAWFTCGSMTFEEAFRKTGRVFCITLSSTTKKAPPVLLNYLSAPNVTIASAVVASAAVPGFISPVSLRYKDANGVIRQQGGDQFFDGSIRSDIPVNGLKEMLNCQFFIACQANPHIVPFFYNGKGGVGRPSRWSSGTQEESYRGGFLLAALEMYLKNDMKAKNVFLNDLEAAVGFTATLLTQEFVGSTTIVPQVSFVDYFKLFSDPSLNDLYKYYQAGRVASYEHTAMIRYHYHIADALDECVARLEGGGRSKNKVKPRPIFTLDDELVLPRSQFSMVALEASIESSEEDDDDDDEYFRRWTGQSL